MKNYFGDFSRLRRLGLLLSGILLAISLTGLLTKGMNLGIDFTGGYLTEFSTSQPVEREQMQKLLETNIDGPFVVTSSNQSTNWIVRQSDNVVVSDSTSLNSNISKSWLTQLDRQLELANNQLTPLDSDYIGSQIGDELIDQGGLAMLVAIIAILLYLSARFEWRFGLSAVVALFHDVFIVIGIFSWTQLEFNLTVLASLLAVIGYSINDSIIITDRIRELMRVNKKLNLSELINTAISSTMTRTLITSGTTLVTVIAVWWLAGTSLQGFSAALFGGILVGTYSSICIAATLPEILGLQVDYYQITNESEDNNCQQH